MNKLICGDALTELKKLPAESVDCVMTSPPYWALRDYGTEGQLGLEPTFQEYISKLCDIFDEVKRVLKKSGTCWVNLGDTYSGMKIGNTTGVYKDHIDKTKSYANTDSFVKPRTSLKDKCLVQIPSRFAIEMTNRGWILRNTIIWHKPNCMPSSAKDRFTVDFEYLFFFSKSKKYYFETQREPHTSTRWGGTNDSVCKEGDYALPNYKEGTRSHKNDYHPQGRNKRAVWKIATKPFPEAHFAVYPPELCETPIKASCPEFVCKKCGKPREKIYETKSNYSKREKTHTPNNTPTKVDSTGWEEPEINFKGLTDCGCNAGFTGGTVLDPFAGAGTTCLVAKQQGKNYIGIDVQADYIKIAEKRLAKVPERLDKFI